MPNTSLFKYFQEQDARHVGPLLWLPDVELPILAEVPIESTTQLRDEGYILTEFNVFYARIFDLENAEDLQYYCWICDRIANGWFVFIRREVVSQERGYKVLLEWIQRYCRIVKPKL